MSACMVEKTVHPIPYWGGGPTSYYKAGDPSQNFKTRTATTRERPVATATEMNLLFRALPGKLPFASFLFLFFLIAPNTCKTQNSSK